MKSVKNAFLELKDYNCFACSPRNDNGLKMRFFHDGDDIVCKWEPQKRFEGWTGIIHGGIQATLIDETGEWYVFTKIGRSAVTLNLDIRYKKPLLSSNGTITIRASLIEAQKGIAEMDIRVYDGLNTLCTVAKGKFYIFSEKESIEKFQFPGIDKF